MRDVGRRAAHVESDDPVEAGEARHLDRADDASGGTREDRVLALEQVRVGEPARRLHELQAHAAGAAVEVALDLPDVAAQDRRQVGVDHRRVAARHELHERRNLVRRRDLGEADRPRDLRDHPLVLREPVTVHQHDRDGADARLVSRAQVALDARFVERAHDFAARAHALVGLDHALVKQARQLDAAHEELRPVLVGDGERVGEALRDHQRGAFALALEERVGRDRRPHLDRLDRLGGYRGAGSKSQQVADPLHRRVAVALGILGQELVRRERAVRTTRDDVGEGAAAVDPELPHSGIRDQRTGIRGGCASGGGASSAVTARIRSREGAL